MTATPSLESYADYSVFEEATDKNIEFLCSCFEHEYKKLTNEEISEIAESFRYGDKDKDDRAYLNDFSN